MMRLEPTSNASKNFGPEAELTHQLVSECSQHRRGEVHRLAQTPTQSQRCALEVA